MLLGPVTFLKLGKSKDATLDPLSLLGGLLPVYVDVLRRLAANGADWVQIDEPCLVLDLDDATPQALRRRLRRARARAAGAEDHADDLFRRLGDNLDTALALPVAGPASRSGARAASSSTRCWRRRRADLVLSLGVIDGRNIWRADLPALLDRLEPAVAQRGTDHVQIAPSCSLLHVPIDLDAGDRSRSRS